MRFEGTLQKDGRFWLAEVPALNALTQGRTRKEAYKMIRDYVETVANVPGFRAFVEPVERDRFELGASDAAVLVALLLRSQRERSGLTLAQAAERLKQRSRNAYARYEQGRAVPTIDKLEELLEAVAPGQRFIWRLAG